MTDEKIRDILSKKIDRWHQRRADRLESRGVHNDVTDKNGAEHDKNGRFTSKGGSSSGGSNGKTEKAVEKTAKQFSFRKTEPRKFQIALKEAADSCDPVDGWRVATDDYSVEDYSGMKIRSTKGGSTYAIKPDGDIISVCKKRGDKARGTDILEDAVRNGGKKLDSFEGNHEFYAKCGFEPVSWCKWSDDYAPESWKKVHGFKDDSWKGKDLSDPPPREDIIFYKYVGKGKVKNINVVDFKKNVPVSDDYDAAANSLEEAMKRG